MIKNEDWINEVLRLTDVEIRRESDESVGKPRETRTQKTKRLNTEAQQLKKRAKDQNEDYDLLLDTLVQCKRVLKILDTPEKVHVNDIVTIKAVNNYGDDHENTFSAVITDVADGRVTVRYDNSVTSNPVTAGRRSGPTNDDGTKTFSLEDFKVCHYQWLVGILRRVIVLCFPRTTGPGLG